MLASKVTPVSCNDTLHDALQKPTVSGGSVKATVEVPMAQASKQLGFPAFVLQRMLSHLQQGKEAVQATLQGVSGGGGHLHQPSQASLNAHWHAPATHLSLEQVHQLNTAVRHIKQGGSLQELSDPMPETMLPPSTSSPKVRPLFALMAQGQAWHVQPCARPNITKPSSKACQRLPRPKVSLPAQRHGFNARPFQRLRVDEALWRHTQPEEEHPFLQQA